MGVERAVVRWYAQKQLLLKALTELHEQIVSDGVSTLPSDDATLKSRRAEIEEKIRLLGPCPMPKMG